MITIKSCKFCGNEFAIKYNSEMPKEYCSAKCANSCPARAAKISETRKKMLQTKSGRAMYEKAMKKRNKLPYYQRKENSNKRQRDVDAGRREYKNWRIAVLSRDDFTCQDCGKVGGILQAHHIKEWSDYPNLRYEVDNGITLCPVCHNNRHGFDVLHKKACPICNKSFYPHRMKQVFCSKKCVGKHKSAKARKEWVKTCKYCETDFFGYSHRKYCSLDCYHKSLRKR